MNQQPPIVMAIVVFVAAVALCVVPVLTSGFGGFDGAAFPTPQVDPVYQPPGVAFSIWFVIYLWTLASAGFGLFARANQADWQPMRPSLAVTLAIGAAWLPVAQVSPFVATILIFAMMIGAIVALHDAPMLDFWMARAPIGLLAGWVTAATAVSLAFMLAGYGFTSTRGAAIFALMFALAIAVFVIWTVRGTSGYAAGVAWALGWIAIGAITQDIVVFVLAALGALLMAAHVARARATV